MPGAVVVNGEIMIAFFRTFRQAVTGRIIVAFLAELRL